MFSTDAVSMYVESICCKYDVRRMTVCISKRSTSLSAREAALPVVLLEESHQLVGLLVHEGTLEVRVKPHQGHYNYYRPLNREKNRNQNEGQSQGGHA